MNIRSWLNDRTILMRVGMSLLLIASAIRWLPRLGVQVPVPPHDFALGLMYGMSIACLLLSLRAPRRRSDPPQEQRRG